ncbi:hypothetical protein AAHE18_19G030500 [Arachis hypogaea]|uniref:Defensin-like protein n=1 Tax=Arachis hypogaea TaxID=3818 RepID=A0A6B9V334_ARAHY|nr:uncharacterized protein DS421_19g638330 [Arachis hypogaea]QHN75791.1 uncharacterized protein DS421_19g638330 [Arachis hypogaea]
MAKLSMAKFFSLFLLVSVMRSEVGVVKGNKCGLKIWYLDNCVPEDCSQLCDRDFVPGVVAVISDCQASTCFCQYLCQ